MKVYTSSEIILRPVEGRDEETKKFLSGSERIKSFERNEYGSYLVTAYNSYDIFEVANSLYHLDFIDICQPNFICSAERFSDPLYSEQYYLNNTGQFGGTVGIDINLEDANFDHDITYRILRSSGELAKTIRSRKTTERIDLSGLKPGIYYLSIHHEGLGVQTERLLIE